MRTKARFKDAGTQSRYATARRIASDNFSEFYYSASPLGPCQPRRGAGHRCAYWDGWYGIRSLYARDRNVLAYAFWAAGQDNRRRARDMAIIHAAMRELEA